MDPILGSIFIFAGDFAPVNYALCNGQALSISDNEALYSLIGTMYGGDGRTTFNLPDLRGRAPIHVSSTIPQATKGGAEMVTLTVPELPQHTHLAAASNLPGTTNIPTNAVPAETGATDKEYFNGGDFNTTMSQQFIEPVGGNQSHKNMQPYMALNFIICTRGLYPVQNY
ncbi:phage tail protein [Pedobacter sp.]|uniref:phage tail protein n=1 Tax=Pedobacter sp. TaxID=1411316 RepID=UPI00396C863E